MPSISQTTSSPTLDVDDALGRAGQDHVARPEGHERAQVFDQAAMSKTMSRVLPLLRDAAVDERAQRQVVRVGHVGGVDQPRPEHGAAVAVLDAQVRPVVVLEVVADRVVVGDGVAGHVAPSRRARVTFFALRADDDREFALVVHERHVGRPARRAAVADQRARPLQERERLVLGVLERELLRMVGVVQAERDDGAGLERRQPDDVASRRARGRRRAARPGRGAGWRRGPRPA